MGQQQTCDQTLVNSMFKVHLAQHNAECSSNIEIRLLKNYILLQLLAKFINLAIFLTQCDALCQINTINLWQNWCCLPQNKPGSCHLLYYKGSRCYNNHRFAVQGNIFIHRNVLWQNKTMQPHMVHVSSKSITNKTPPSPILINFAVKEMRSTHFAN